MTWERVVAALIFGGLIGLMLVCAYGQFRFLEDRPPNDRGKRWFE